MLSSQRSLSPRALYLSPYCKIALGKKCGDTAFPEFFRVKQSTIFLCYHGRSHIGSHRSHLVQIDVFAWSSRQAEQSQNKHMSSPCVWPVSGSKSNIHLRIRPLWENASRLLAAVCLLSWSFQPILGQSTQSVSATVIKDCLILLLLFWSRLNRVTAASKISVWWCPCC